MDFLIIQLSYFLAVLWYHYSFGEPLIFEYYYKQQCIMLFACMMASMAINRPYKNILKRDKWQEVGATVKHAVAMAIFDLVLLFIMKDTDTMSRLTFAATWVIYLILELGCRLVWKKLIRSYIIKRGTRRQILVLTSSDRAKFLEKNLELYVLRDYDIAGIFLSDFNKTNEDIQKVLGVEVLGGADELIDYTVHNWVDEVIFDLPNDNALAQDLGETISEMGITTHYTITVMENVGQETSEDASYIEKIGNCVVLTHKTREIAPIQIILKRFLDILGGLIGSLIAVIIIIIVGPIIKKKSPGPIIFTQERVGKNGKTFKMYKIRSMYMDAEERKAALMSQNKMDGFMFKLDDDPRIIGSEKKDKNGNPKGIGNFIRNTSLDEFPQFFNVIKGDMSLVGTRPPTVDEWNKYTPHHRKRLSIKPGITGLWQISGRSKITDFDEVVKLDSEYIDTWTFQTDLKILLKTIEKVAKKEGAE